VKYFRNTELAKIYKVSEKTVRNWIQATQDGKLELQLFEKNGKSLVANTSKNAAIISELAQKGKKYKNSRGFKIVSPTPLFYKTYSPKQILDIISNLIIYHEIPLQYGYLDGGADYWDRYSKRLSTENTSNILNATIELQEITNSNIDQLLKEHKSVNVVDIGPGNGLPIRSTLERLVKQGRLRRYIAIDISQEMLTITERNIKDWFGDTVTFEGHIRDISYERFDDLFADDYMDNGATTPANLVFLLGGTLSNFRSPGRVLQTINSSLGLNDIFIYSGFLDTPNTRRYFDFNVDQNNPTIAFVTSALLNMNESLYDIDRVFNEVKLERCTLLRPKLDLSIQFELGNGTRFVELRKSEPILVWRHRHYNAIDFIKLCDDNDFDLLQATKSREQEYFIFISKIKTDI
jgi:uncharacterized SAM-dependent methyltransferase